MRDHMTMPWPMSGSELLEMGFFWTLAVLFLVVLIRLLCRAPRDSGVSPPRGEQTGMFRGWFYRWRDWPETWLLLLALPLELLWEIAQFPLYDVWHQNDWGYILYGLAHCTLGDLLILLALYELVALLVRNRAWFRNARVWPCGLLFTALGLGYTVYSELVNVRIKGTWGYTELMPIVPGVEIGGTPFMQWLLIPPILLWLMRLTWLARQVRAS